MNFRTTFGLIFGVLLTGLPSAARADYVEYDLGLLGKAITELAGAKLQGMDAITSSKITLPGKAIVQGGPSPLVTYTHPNGTMVHFPLRDVKVIRAPTTKQLANKMMTQARNDPEAVMKAAVWALKKGQLADFYKGVDKVLDLDPKNEAALSVIELKKRMKEPLPESSEAEKRFRGLVKNPHMKIEVSNHYMLMHDTEPKPPKGKTKSRAAQRLDLLEKVYESFMLLFHAQDVQLDIPSERQMVVLFKNYDQFQEYSIAIHPSLASAAGFYDPISNVAYFYDFATDDLAMALDKFAKIFRDEAKDARKWRNNPEAIRYSKVIDMLLDVAKDNSDITVVSHECTHQMAGNTGLFPRHIRTPKWVHEGLASYFEVPSDGTWAGIGAVSRRRVTAYRELAEADRMKIVSNVDFVVSDQIFRLGPEFGYAFGWAMTHFMVENHLKEFVDFYRILGEVPPEVSLSPEMLVKLFHHAVKTDITALDAEWKAYMKSLKTDLERLEEMQEERERS
jgi:hypothetical protein